MDEQTIKDKKAEAYDTLARIEALQRYLQQINQEIANLSQEQSEPPKKD